MHLCKVPNLIRHKNSLKDCILLVRIHTLYNTVALLQQACVVKCNNCIHAAGARGDDASNNFFPDKAKTFLI